MPVVTTRPPWRAVATHALLAVSLVGPAAAVSASPALADATASPTVAGTSLPSPTSTATDPTTAGTTDPTTAGTTDPTTAGTTDPTTAGTTDPATAGTTDPTTAGTTASTNPTTTPAPKAPSTAAPDASSSALAAVSPGTTTERAAAYLVAGLQDGDHVAGPFGPDLGQTADVVLALSATPGQHAARDAAAAYLAAHIDDYVHGAAFADGSEGSEKHGAHYAGPTGKAIVAALAAGQDPRSLGGFDLVAELQDLLVTSGSSSGRFADDSAFGDYSNPLGQAFDIIALKRTTGSVPSSAVRYLLTAQCADGGFTDAYPASPKACTSNPDSTGLALQALVASGAGDPDSAAGCAAGGALSWLTAHAATNGSYASGAVDPSASSAANVNSTAYAALGRTAAKAGTSAQVAYLTSVQNTDGGLPIVPSSADTTSNMLATAQAVNALTRSTYLTLGTSPLAATAPACTPTPSTVTATTQPTTTGATGATSSSRGSTPADLTTVAAAADTLPRTGADPRLPGLLGLGLVLTGSVVVAASRHRHGARQR